jgi:hypothetical protein
MPRGNKCQYLNCEGGPNNMSLITLPCGKRYYSELSKQNKQVDLHKRVCQICAAQMPVRSVPETVITGIDGSLRPLNKSARELARANVRFEYAPIHARLLD